MCIPCTMLTHPTHDVGETNHEIVWGKLLTKITCAHCFNISRAKLHFTLNVTKNLKSKLQNSMYGNVEIYKCQNCVTLAK